MFLANTCKDVDCIGHADCETNFGSKYMCERFTCVEKTCRTNAHCNFGLINGKNRCFENECEKVECSNHDHCLNKGVDYRCNKNQCEKVDCRLNSSCAEDELCDKEQLKFFILYFQEKYLRTTEVMRIYFYFFKKTRADN